MVSKYSNIILALFSIFVVMNYALATETKVARQFSINTGWKYLEDPIENVNQLSQSSVPWVTVDVPHTWNAFDVVDAIPGYRRSASWYQKNIEVPGSLTDSRVILSFEGANIQTRVYVNKKLAGEHIGGYIGFEFDITELLVDNEPNIIDIRVDNSINPNIIPSQKSDFYIYGGLCRNVWMKIVPKVALATMKIQTPKVSKSKATTNAIITINNTTQKEAKVQIEAIITDAQGKQVARKEVKQELKQGSNNITIEFPSISNPQLWSPDKPTLYTVQVSLKQSGLITDFITDRIGYRFFEFKEHGPFFLNGERLLLKGTQRHEEYAGLGNALPDSLQRKDVALAKEMGANFLRLAHYPQAPEVYRACDELGILVWDELPWCRGGAGGEEWKKITRNLLIEQINVNYNHPSIIMWSMGNEIYMESDFPDGVNNDSLRAFLSELNALSHKLDPYRVTSIRKYYEGAELIDVFSPSIWSGWYSGAYNDYEKTITEARDKYKRLFHAEYGGDSHVGRHTENPITGDGYLIPEGKEADKTKIKNISLQGDWSESYMVNLFDWYLHVTLQLDWFAGSAQWILKDFGTPLRPENPIPYVNQKGLVDRNGKPKDAFYVYKSYWTTNPKFCYIESHTWNERSGHADLKRTVKVFSNCEQVELVLNGSILEKKTRDTKVFPACGLSWQVKFNEGENLLKAVGYSNGEVVSVDTLTVNYTYKKSEETAEIVVSASKMANGNYLITALAIDKKGERNLSYSKRIYFTSEGPGRLLENYGTPTRSSIIEMANGKAQIEYEPSGKGTTIIEARNQDFKGAYVTIENK